MPLAQSTRFLASGGQTTSFTMLVNGVDNPVNSRVFANDGMLWVNKDDFEVLVGRVLIDPVGVEDTEVRTSAANTLFGGSFE